MTDIIKDMMLNAAERVGSVVLSWLQSLGAFFLFVYLIMKSFIYPPYYLTLIKRHCIFIGFFSIPVVAMTGFFSGAVISLHSYNGLSRFSAESSIATVVILAITRELGPVLPALMVAGRVGASIAAEIGTMRVTEQIDALSTLATNPVKYLLIPRIVAFILVMPLLTLMADIVGVFGGYVVCVYKLGFNSSSYLISSLKHLTTIDVTSGLFKSVIFGLIISIVSCHSGYFSKGGAKGVGVSTTMAVVYSSVLILLSNYFMTEYFYKE